MNNSLQKKEVQVEIAEQVVMGKITTADDLVEMYNVSFSQAISLLASPNFIAIVSAMSKAKAQLAWHARVMPKLEKLIGDDDPKIAMQAMKMLGQITDSIKGGDFNININLENLVRQSEEVSNNLNPDPSNIIELEEYKKILENEE